MSYNIYMNSLKTYGGGGGGSKWKLKIGGFIFR